MKDKMIRMMGVLLLFFSVAGCIHDDNPSGKGQSLEVGDVLPAFSVELENGRRLDNAVLEGKVSVLVFFRVACTDCREELPCVQRLYEYYAADHRVQIVALNWKEKPETVAGYWQQEGLTLPYAVQCGEDVYREFGCRVVPQVYVSDATQKVRYLFGDSPVASFEELQQSVEACLAGE